MFGFSVEPSWKPTELGETGNDGEKEQNERQMSLVDYASSSDDDVPEPTRHKEEEPPQPLQRNSPPPQPQPQPPPSRTQ